ncbi:unnamed protein product [Allacma fusca]|uniref:Uncharacterized protein n=1 Tax=Allacma fusca TaxID=39272 RepID=A0A8J2P9J7_9HEXA|nr:unnamed protein product [Allacma fusca]
MSLSWYVLNFVVCPDIPIIIFNELFAEDSIRDYIPEYISGRKKTRSIFKFSKQELLAIFLQPCHLVCGLTVTIASIANPDMKLLLYTALNNDYQNSLTFSFLLVFEYLILVFWTNSIYFTLELQILFFEKLTTTLDSYTKFQLKSASKNTLNTCCKKIQKISLLINLFNSSNSVIIFILKVVCATFGIVSGFFAVEYFGLNPALGVYNYSISIDMSILYAVTFEKAFHIPDKIHSFKNEILIKARRLQLSTPDQKYIERLVKSIPEGGIKVGIFKTFERISTPEFVDFLNT